MVVLIPLIVLALIVVASALATDSRDGRDWSAPMFDQRDSRGARPDQHCCA